MAKAKAVFKSGNSVGVSSILTSGSLEELEASLRERELGICDKTLYAKVGGSLIEIASGDMDLVFDLLDNGARVDFDLNDDGECKRFERMPV